VVKLGRLALLAAVLTSTVVLAGCSEQNRHEWKNLAMPDPASEQGEHIFTLWRWSWVAALITGGCANTAYERCEEDLLLARTFGPRALVAVCDYGDGTGEVVQIWRKRDARNACSVDGGISSPLAAVVRMP